MERVGKRGYLGRYRGRDRESTNEGRGGRALEPISQRQVELDPSQVMERGHFPERDIGYPQRGLIAGRIDDPAMGFVKRDRARDPMNEDVSIE